MKHRGFITYVARIALRIAQHLKGPSHAARNVTPPSQIALGCNSPQRPTDLAEIIFPSRRRCTIMLRERRKIEHTP